MLGCERGRGICASTFSRVLGGQGSRAILEPGRSRARAVRQVAFSPLALQHHPPSRILTFTLCAHTVMADPTASSSEAFTFGTSSTGSSSDSAEKTSFTFASQPPSTSSTSSTTTTTTTTRRNMSDASSGYLDDRPAGTSRLAPTSLFATLAQRQLDQHQRQGEWQPMSQHDYDHAFSWTPHSVARSRHHRRHRRHRRRRSSLSSSSTEDSDETDDTNSTFDSDKDSLALQREWDEQVDQLKLMFQIIIFPFVGKFLGRKFGYFRKSNPHHPPRRASTSSSP